MFLSSTLHVVIVVALILAIWFLIVSVVAMAITNKKLKECTSKMDMFDSKLNDVQLINSTFLKRIERRCDAIDQRTKAHLNTKKNASKKKYTNSVSGKQSHNKGQYRSNDRSLF